MGKLIMVDFSREFREGLIRTIQNKGVAHARGILLEHGYCEAFISVMIKSVTCLRAVK